MNIPDFQSIMLPLLQFASDQKEHSLKEAVESLTEKFKLTDSEKRKLLPSKTRPIFHNRVGWARTYLSKAGLVKVKPILPLTGRVTASCSSSICSCDQAEDSA